MGRVWYPVNSLMRFEDWPTRLDAFLESRKQTAFAWGEHDCCLFACDAIQTITGVDLAADYRGKYSTAKEALDLMGEEDIGDMMTRIGAQHGVVEVPVAYAQRGDAVLVEHEHEALGIVALSGVDVWVPGELFLVRAPIETVLRAWKI